MSKKRLHSKVVGKKVVLSVVVPRNAKLGIGAEISLVTPLENFTRTGLFASSKSGIKGKGSALAAGEVLGRCRPQTFKISSGS